MGNFIDWAACFIFMLLLCGQSDAPAEANYGYKEGQSLTVMFNSFTSDESIFPLSPKLFPLCSSKSNEFKESPMNLGQILMGDEIQSSPYQFKMNINESFVHICDSTPLLASQIQQYRKIIDENYHINMFLDDLPAMSPEPVLFRKPWTGSPVGVYDYPIYYVFNHLKLTILIKEDDISPKVFSIVGFKADPCPCCRNQWPFLGPQIYGLHPLPLSCNGVTVTRELRENETIPFSYEVSFEKSNLKPEFRWDPYVDTKPSIDLILMLLFQFALCFVRFCSRASYRRIRRIASINSKVIDEEACLLHSETSIHSPPLPMVLSVLVGSGMQILCAICATLLIGWLGFLSSSSRGLFITQIIYCYVASAAAAGYTSVRVLNAIDTTKNNQWAGVTWRVACVFPLISAVGLVSLNTIHAGGVMSVSLVKKLMLTWSFVNVPLASLGGYLGARSRSRRICHSKERTRIWVFLLYIFSGGWIIYSFSYPYLDHTVSRFVLGFYFTNYGYHLLTVVLFFRTCLEVAISCQLWVGDKWWWASFIGPASAPWLYYSISQEWYKLKYSSIASSAVYGGYCFLFLLNYMVAVGTVGFMGAFFSLSVL